MIRRTFLGGMMVIAMVVAGYDRRLIEGTEVGKLMVADSTGPADERFGDAIFAMVEGQTRAEAVDTLTADGATCVEAVCTWRYEHRVTLRDRVGFGPGYPAGCRASDSGACTEWIVYQVTLGAPFINERSQISTTIDQGLTY